MLHLLKVEWLKLRNYRTFWILASLYAISNFGLSYVVYRIYQEITADAKKGIGKAILGEPFAFPEIWITIPYFCGFLLFIPGLILIISITNEFSYKTHRQNIVDGWSRTQFIGVKLMLVLITSVIATLLVGSATVLRGYLAGSSFSFENIEFLFFFFIQALAYCSVALLFSVLIKRSGLTIGVYFLYLFLLENVAGSWLNYKYKDAGNYLPLNSTDSLIPFPFARSLTDSLLSQTSYSILIPLSFVYLALYVIFCIRRFQRADL